MPLKPTMADRRPTAPVTAEPAPARSALRRIGLGYYDIEAGAIRANAYAEICALASSRPPMVCALIGSDRVAWVYPGTTPDEVREKLEPAPAPGGEVEEMLAHVERHALDGTAERLRREFARLAADNARLTAEATEANEIAAEYLAFADELIKAPGKSLCGWCFAPFTPVDEMQAHLRACDKHPMRSVEAERDRLAAEVERLTGEHAALRAKLADVEKDRARLDGDVRAASHTRVAAHALLDALTRYREGAIAERVVLAAEGQLREALAGVSGEVRPASGGLASEPAAGRPF